MFWFYILGAAIFMTTGFFAGDRFATGYYAGEIASMQSAQVTALANAAKDAEALGISEGQITFTAGQNFAQQQTKIVTRTITQIKEVVKYVPAEANVRCVLPLSVVQLLNGAASSSDDPASAFPLASGQLASATASTDLASLAANITDNYGKYNEVSAQLVALQKWVIDTRTAANK